LAAVPDNEASVEPLAKPDPREGREKEEPMEGQALMGAQVLLERTDGRERTCTPLAGRGERTGRMAAEENQELTETPGWTEGTDSPGLPAKMDVTVKRETEEPPGTPVPGAQMESTHMVVQGRTVLQERTETPASPAALASEETAVDQETTDVTETQEHPDLQEKTAESPPPETQA
jgi:hypothetical protein